MKRPLATTPAILALLLAGCAAQVPPPPPPIRALPVQDTTPKPPPAREPPPPSGPAKPFHFPRVAWTELPGEMKLATISEKGPLVHVRVVAEGGRSLDGERPGLAGLTAGLLAEGAAPQIAALGGDLSVRAGLDATTFRFAVTRGALGEALDALGAALARPRWAPGDLDRLKKREIARLAAAARDDGVWGASVMLYRDLFSLPAEHHPYASWSATPEEIARITAVDCRGFQRGFYGPAHTFVVVEGDVTSEDANALVRKAFSSFTGAARGSWPVFTDPNPAEALKITLVDHPGSADADLLVGVLGPARNNRELPFFAVAGRILGDETNGRLATELRRGSGLVRDARTDLVELAHGPSVLVTRATAPAAAAGAVLDALLSQGRALAKKAPDPDEVEAAQRAVLEREAVQLDTPGAAADEVARLHTLGLPDDAIATYRKDVGEVTPALVTKSAAYHLSAEHEIIVVAGDAAVIGPVLAHFGEVKVLDPTREFARERTIPVDPGAPLTPPTPDPAKPTPGKV